MIRRRYLALGCGAALLIAYGFVALCAWGIVSIIRMQHGEALARKGAAALSAGKAEDAWTKLTSALATNLPKPWRAYALCERGFAEQQKKDNDGAFRDFSEAILLNPKLANAYYGRALVWNSRSQPGKALPDFDQAIALNPNFYLAFWYRGYLFLRESKWPEAVADFSEAIRCAPGESGPYFERSFACEKNHDLDGALASADSAVALRPEKSSALARRAAVYRARREWEKALADYAEVASLQPKSAVGWRGRAVTLAKKGETKNALVAFRDATKNFPNDSGLLNDFAWFLATTMDNSVRDGKQAVTLATKACEHSHWQNSAFVDTLAVACAATADFPSAIKYEKEAVALENYSEVRRQEKGERLKLFQKSQPFRMAPTSDALPND